MSHVSIVLNRQDRGRGSELVVAGHIQACGLPVYRPEGGLSPLHDLLVEVERGELVSIQVRTLALRSDRPTYEGSVVTRDNLHSEVFAFVALEFGVSFIVPRSEIPVARRVSWQPPALRSRARMRGAFDLDPYLMAFDKLWAGIGDGPRFGRRQPQIDEARRRSRGLVFPEATPTPARD